MSSRSIGVMKVVFSFLTISWVIWSPCVLDFLDGVGLGPGVGEVVDQLAQQLRGLDDVLRLLLEEVEEPDFAGDQVEHAPRPSVTETSRMRHTRPERLHEPLRACGARAAQQPSARRGAPSTPRAERLRRATARRRPGSGPRAPPRGRRATPTHSRRAVRQRARHARRRRARRSPVSAHDDDGREVRPRPRPAPEPQSAGRRASTKRSWSSQPRASRTVSALSSTREAPRLAARHPARGERVDEDERARRPPTSTSKRWRKRRAGGRDRVVGDPLQRSAPGRRRRRTVCTAGSPAVR